MQVETIGKDPEVAVVGLIHGDEPAGKKAIERAIDQLEFKDSVKFVIANEKAFEENERYIEEDLNRVFPGGDSREGKLARKILEEVEGMKVLDLHSTQSFDKPFATVNTFEEPEINMVKATGVEYAVKFDKKIGALMEYVEGIVVETGLQASEKAAENAFNIIKRFLAYFDVIDESYEPSDPELFVQEVEVKGDYRFLKENFEKVEEGETYARNCSEELVAKEAFYPVLMSTNGYKGTLGHKASKMDK